MGNCCCCTKKRDPPAGYHQRNPGIPVVINATRTPQITIPQPQLQSQPQKQRPQFQHRQPSYRRGKPDPNRSANYNAAVSYLSKVCSVPAASLKDWLNSAVIITPSGQGQGYEHKLITEYVNNGQVHGYGIRILSIIKICQRSVLEFRHRPGYNRADKRMMLWHGTSRGNVPSILENGLRIPTVDYGLMQGMGIYFADRASKSCHYCRECNCWIRSDGVTNHSCGSEGVLFLCDVQLGRVKVLPQPNHELVSVPPGYDSVKCPGKQIPKAEPRGYPKLYGSLVPKGPTVGNVLHPDNVLAYNEYTVYDPDRINIKYVVHFRFCPGPYKNP